MSCGTDLAPSSLGRVDRHTHLEGSADQAWTIDQARSRALALPIPLLRLWRGEAVSFDEFAEAFLFLAGLLDSPNAICSAVMAATARLTPGDGAVGGIDLWVSPQLLRRAKPSLNLASIWRGLDDGIALAAKQGVRVAVVVDTVKRHGPKEAAALLDQIVPERPSWVVGFSSGGVEGSPFREWAAVFSRAKQAGFHVATHAGETAGADSVRDAVLHGHIDRLIHAVRAVEDPVVLDLLAERRIPVDVCIQSNRVLVPHVYPHPLPTMLRAGVRCALGTDDPGLILCDMGTEVQAAREAGCGLQDLRALARYAHEDAWCLLLRRNDGHFP